MHRLVAYLEGVSSSTGPLLYRRLGMAFLDLLFVFKLKMVVKAPRLAQTQLKGRV